MFDSLKPVIYIQISPDNFSVKNVRSGETISGVAELALSALPEQKILGLGTVARDAAAAHAGAVIVRPFAHPRSPGSDFTPVLQIIKAFVARLKTASALAMSPVIIIHPLGKPDGGFTEIESRAFRELGFAVGVRKVILWYGGVLTDQEMLSGQYPSHGRAIE